MTQPKTTCEVGPYEVNGKKTLDGPSVVVKSHWNMDRFVVVQTAEGASVTVSARELIKAVERCSR